MNQHTTKHFVSFHLFSVLILFFIVFISAITSFELTASPVSQEKTFPLINNSALSIENYTFEVDDWKRELTIEPWGGILVTDIIVITSNAEGETDRILFLVPPNLTINYAEDIFGRYSLNRIDVHNNQKYSEVYVFLRDMLSPGEKVKLLLSYRLPSELFISQISWQDYSLNISLSKPDIWFVKEFSLVINLPEGAEFISSTRSGYQNQKSGFTVSTMYKEYDLKKIEEPSFTIEYKYILLWSFFRPALWIGTGIIGLTIIFFFRRNVKPSTNIVTQVPKNVIIKFVSIFNEKRRIISNIQSLEGQILRGKLSRRKYKTRRISIDLRLSKIKKELKRLKIQMEETNQRYSNQLKQLETADSEIETLDKDINRVEIRYRRKEISSEARRKLLDEYTRIKERAENTISEILLRLQEEIH